MLGFIRLPAVVGLVLIFAGCARHREPVVIEPAPAPVVAYSPAPVQVSPINRDLSAAATLWHFRVGLNVAALACRGPSEATIVAGYNALLANQRAALAAAQATLSAEYKARGGDWQDSYDDSMTRLYNFFSQAQARERFCAIAVQVLADAQAMPGGTIGALAEARLATLDAPFVTPFDARPVIAVAAIAPQPMAAQRVLAAQQLPASTPWLKVNVAALGE